MTLALPAPSYKVGQKVEVHSLPNIGDLQTLNGQLVIVECLPGYHERADFSEAYGVRFKDGSLQAIHPRHLRPFPPMRNRGDMDKPSSWEQFEKATGISPDVVKNGRPGNE